jgi:hypothetical protein
LAQRHLAGRASLNPQAPGKPAEARRVHGGRAPGGDSLGQIAAVQQAKGVGVTFDSASVRWTGHSEIEQGGVQRDRIGAREKGQRGEVADPTGDAKRVGPSRSGRAKRQTSVAIEGRDVGSKHQRIQRDHAG